MGEVFAPPQSLFAALHSLDESGLFFEMARKHVPKQLVRIAPLLGGGMRQLRFEVWREMHFHCCDSSSNRTPKSPSSGPVRRRSAARPLGQQEIAVHAGDDFQLDFLGAYGFAFADVGAASEALGGGLRYHRNHAGVALRLALRQQTEMRDLGAHEERRRGVG